MDHRQLQCCICLDHIDHDDEVVTGCVFEHQSGSGLCKDCEQAYLSSVIGSTINGTAPVIRCPCVHIDGSNQHLIPYKLWSQRASASLLDKYEWRAKMMAPFLCPNCHVQKSCLLDYREPSLEKMTTEYTKLLNHEIEVEDYYRVIMVDISPLEIQQEAGPSITMPGTMYVHLLSK